MKKAIYIFLFFIPSVSPSQSSLDISYQDGLDKCKQIVEENQRSNPDTFIYTGPECMIGARIPEFSEKTLDGKEITIEYFRNKVTV